jgi:hypothetical protein
MDGNKQIMISKALNESDRLSSCSKGMRRLLEDRELLFNVFSFKAVEDEDTGGNPDEFLLRYNIGGIHINEAAFQKLRSGEWVTVGGTLIRSGGLLFVRRARDLSAPGGLRVHRRVQRDLGVVQRASGVAHRSNRLLVGSVCGCLVCDRHWFAPSEPGDDSTASL